MSRRSWARLVVPFVLVFASCATTDELVLPQPGTREVLVPAHPDRERIEVTEQELRQAMEWLLREVKPQLERRTRRMAPSRFVPVQGEALDVQRLAMVTEYRAWCGRRGQNSDCLALLEDGRTWMTRTCTSSPSTARSAST